MAARRQLLGKTFLPVRPLLNTSMEPIVILVKNECCELRLEVNEEEQWIVLQVFTNYPI